MGDQANVISAEVRLCEGASRRQRVHRVCAARAWRDRVRKGSDVSACVRVLACVVGRSMKYQGTGGVSTCAAQRRWLHRYVADVTHHRFGHRRRRARIQYRRARTHYHNHDRDVGREVMNVHAIALFSRVAYGDEARAAGAGPVLICDDGSGNRIPSHGSRSTRQPILAGGASGRVVAGRKELEEVVVNRVANHAVNQRHIRSVTSL